MNVTCLTAPIPTTEEGLADLPTGLSIMECPDSNSACAKMTMSMSLMSY